MPTRLSLSQSLVLRSPLHRRQSGTAGATVSLPHARVRIWRLQLAQTCAVLLSVVLSASNNCSACSAQCKVEGASGPGLSTTLALPAGRHTLFLWWCMSRCHSS
jgi:hypothetical protein